MIFLYIPSHLFEIFFNSLFIIINSRFSDIIVPYTNKIYIW